MTLPSSFADPPFRIYLALAQYPVVIFNRDFFYQAPNHLMDFLPDEENLSEALRVIKVEDYRPNHVMNLLMDSGKGQAIAYLISGEELT